MPPSTTVASPLLNPVYRRLFTAQVVALLGTGLSTVALALLAYRLAGDDAGQVLGTALALKMVAYLGVAPLIGGIAHRLPRKGLLVGLDVARAGLVACLPLVTEVWQVFVLIFLLNACSAAFTPLFQAAIPDVLPDEARYTRALSLARLAYDLENLLSPTLAALALLMVSFDALFAGNAVGFAISALLVASAKVPAPAPGDRPGGVLANMAFGIKAYLGTPRLRGLLALHFAVAAGGGMVIVNTVVLVKGGMGLDDGAVARLLVAAGAGSMTVALLLPRLLERLPDRPVMMMGGALLVGGLAGGALEPGYLGLFPLWFVLGAGSSLVLTPSARLVRRSAKDSDRGAYFAANFALSHGGWLVAYPAAGWLGSEMGMTFTFIFLSSLAAGATLLAMMLWPNDDPVVVEHRHEAMEHRHPHVHDEHHEHEHEGWEGPEPHAHPHYHAPVTHRHKLTIDLHHPHWPG